MSETVSNDGVSTEPEKPVSSEDDVKFPPFPGNNFNSVLITYYSQ